MMISCALSAVGCQLSVVSCRVVGLLEFLLQRIDHRQLTTDNRQRAKPQQSPISRSHLYRPGYDGLTGQPLVRGKTALRRHPYFDHRRWAEVFRSREHENPASPAHPDAAARVADRGIGATGGIQHGFVRSGLGGGAEWGEFHEHVAILASSVHKKFASAVETFGGHGRLYMQTIGGFDEQRDQDDGRDETGGGNRGNTRCGYGTGLLG